VPMISGELVCGSFARSTVCEVKSSDRSFAEPLVMGTTGFCFLFWNFLS